MKKLSFKKKVILAIALLLCNTALFSAFHYQTNNRRPFKKAIDSELKRKIYLQTHSSYIVKIDNNTYYWYRNRKKLFHYESGKVVFICPPAVARIGFVTYHPKYGIVIAAITHNRTYTFYRMKNGIRISKLGQYHSVGSFHKFRNRYVFRAATSWKRWFFVDAATGKRINKLGTYRRLYDIQKMNSHYLFVAMKRYKYNFINADTGRIVGDSYSYIDRRIYKIGRHYVCRVRNRGGYYINIASGQPIWGKYRSVGKIEKAGRKQVFNVRDGREYFFVDTRTGRQIWERYRRVYHIKKIGYKYIFQARKNGKNFFVDTANGRKYGTTYDRVRDFQYAAGHYYYKAKLDGQWFYVDALRKRRVGKKYYKLPGKIQRAGNNFYFQAKLNRQENVYVNLGTGKIAGRSHTGWLKKIERAGRKYIYIVTSGRYAYYASLKTGEPIGGKYFGIGKLQKIGSRYIFPVKEDKKRYYYVDANSGRRVWHIYNYLYLSDKFRKVGRKKVFQARKNRLSFFVDTSSGRPIWGKYRGTIYGITSVGNHHFFRVRKKRKYYYVSTATGRQVAGKYYFVSRIRRIFNKIIFLVRDEHRKYYYINALTGKQIWGKYDYVEKIIEIEKKYVLKVRIGEKFTQKKEYYLDLETGKPWGGIFNEVKKLSYKKGLVSFLAREGDNWKSIYPFKRIDYTGMKFLSKRSKLYPSQMTIRNKQKRVFGIVTLKNPYKEKIEVKLELSSMSFPSFYGKKASLLGARIIVKPKSSVKDIITLPFSEKFWELYKKRIINCTLTAYVKTPSGREGSQSIDISLTIASRDRMKWNDIRNIAPFANTSDPTISELARMVKSLNTIKNYQVSPKIDIPLKAYEVCRSLNLNYSFMSLGMGDEDSIKMPFEIIKERLGKCTDTTILYATLLSKLGYSTIITTYSYKMGRKKISHLMMLIDTGVSAKYYRFLHKNKKMVVVPKGMKRCYIPIETTGLVSSQGKSSDFLAAWKKGVFQYRQHSRQILNPKNTFRLQSAWESGFSQMTPSTKSKFTFPQNKRFSLEENVRDLLHKYAAKWLENKKEELRLKKRVRPNNFNSQMDMGKYFYTVRKYMSATPYFRQASKIKPNNTTALYYLLSTVVYTRASHDPRIKYTQRKQARKAFNTIAKNLGNILIRKSSRSKSYIMYAMNYDLAKWYNAFSQPTHGKIHKKIADNILQRINRSKQIRYSRQMIYRLRKKGLSYKAIKTFQKRGFSARTIYKLATKGFSEDVLISFATKGFSEDMLISFATKGFSEDMLISFATKGFSEDMLISFATKGSAEESWSMSY